MSRVDDVINNFIHIRGCAGLEEDSKELLSDAVRYGFQQGESFGKYGAYIEKQNERRIEVLIQPENDRIWREKLENIRKYDNDTNLKASSIQWKIIQLLYLIVEILLVRKNGG